LAPLPTAGGATASSRITEKQADRSTV
jgi:hypothetical protein